jgi:hypothetical protein
MPCQWYVRGGGEGKRRIVIGQSVPPTPFGMAFGRLKLSPQKAVIRSNFTLGWVDFDEKIILNESTPMESIHVFVKVPKTGEKIVEVTIGLRKGTL